MKKYTGGFSMMEVLVVIAIMAILALMLFPVYSRVQARGREVRCASNLRQLHTATMSYIANNNGRLPYSASAKVYSRTVQGSPWQETGWVTGWVDSHPRNADNQTSYWWENGGSNGTFCVHNGTLFQYLGDQGDESVYVCPSMMLEARKMFSNEKSRVTRSYGMNNHVSYESYQYIDGVSRIILFGDQGFGNMGLSAHQYLSQPSAASSDDLPRIQDPGTLYLRRFNRAFDGSLDYTPEAVPKFATREVLGEYHGNRPGRNTGTANVIFLDGHVERVSYLDTVHVCVGNWEYGRRVDP